MKKYLTISIAVLFIITALFLINGCKNKEASTSANNKIANPVASSEQTSSEQQGNQYVTYHNQRFNYSITYPKDILYPQGESDNGDGQKFLSKEADASLTVYGSNNTLNQSMKDLYLEESRGGTQDNPKKVVTYKMQKNNWFVISGHNSGKIFYQKTILNKDQFKSFNFEYPESKKKIYDPITTHIANSFKG